MKIAFYDTKPYDEISFNKANGAFGFDLTYLKPRLSAQTAPLAAGHPVVCAFVNDSLDGEAADILYENGVRLVALRSAGYNNVELPRVFGRGLFTSIFPNFTAGRISSPSTAP